MWKFRRVRFSTGRRTLGSLIYEKSRNRVAVRYRDRHLVVSVALSGFKQIIVVPDLMRSKNRRPKPMANQLGDLLRHWRNIRGKNQLDLSFETELSQRHISFIESGRSVPSCQALMKIAQVLDVPLRERNLLLLSAGYNFRKGVTS
jgi:DNA-binding XRE family transcriptional regulator